MPVETTALLMGLCLPDTSSPPDPFMANIADFTQLYTDRCVRGVWAYTWMGEGGGGRVDDGFLKL